MGIYRRPQTHERLHLNPLDFNRISEFAEEMFAQFAEHMLIDPTAHDATTTEGVILWGLRVTDASEGGMARVSISPGAAVVPEDAPNGRAWRLALHENTSQLVFNNIGSDAIQLALTYVDDGVENRNFRVITPAGRGIVTAPFATYTRPMGTVTRRANSNEPDAGQILLATVTHDAAVVSEIIDKREPLFEVPDGTFGDGGGKAARGLMKSWRWIRGVIDQLKGRVDDVIDETGQLNQFLHCSDGGPNITINQGNRISFGARQVKASEPCSIAGVRPTREETETAGASAEDYENSQDGLKLNGATVCRAFCQVHIDIDPENMARWAGQNVDDVTGILDAAGKYDVTFSPALFGGPVGNLETGAWRVRAYPIHFVDGVGNPSNKNAVNIKVYKHPTNPERAVRIQAYEWNVVERDWAESHLPFALELLGPIGRQPIWRDWPNGVSFVVE